MKQTETKQTNEIEKTEKNGRCDLCGNNKTEIKKTQCFEYFQHLYYCVYHIKSYASSLEIITVVTFTTREKKTYARNLTKPKIFYTRWGRRRVQLVAGGKFMKKN